MTKRYLGMDPGFANFGWAVVEAEAPGARVKAFGVFRTDKDKKAKATLDDYRRTGELALEMRPILDGEYGRIHAVAAEAMSRPPSTTTAIKMGRAWGVVAALCSGLEVYQVNPSALKRTLTGRIQVDDVELHAAVEELFPEIRDPMLTIPKALREHAYDAIAAVHCARLGRVMK